MTARTPAIQGATIAQQMIAIMEITIINIFDRGAWSAVTRISNFPFDVIGIFILHAALDRDL